MASFLSLKDQVRRLHRRLFVNFILLFSLMGVCLAVLAPIGLPFLAFFVFNGFNVQTLNRWSSFLAPFPLLFIAFLTSSLNADAALQLLMFGLGALINFGVANIFSRPIAQIRFTKAHLDDTIHDAYKTYLSHNPGQQRYSVSFSWLLNTTSPEPAKITIKNDNSMMAADTHQAFFTTYHSWLVLDGLDEYLKDLITSQVLLLDYTFTPSAHERMAIMSAP